MVLHGANLSLLTSGLFFSEQLSVKNSDFQGSLKHAELEDSFFLPLGETQEDMKQSRFWPANPLRKQEQLKSCFHLEESPVTTTILPHWLRHKHNYIEMPVPDHKSVNMPLTAHSGYSQCCCYDPTVE